MIPRKGYIRRKIEAALLRLAACILMHRNDNRSLVVSRRDNNDMCVRDYLTSFAKRPTARTTCLAPFWISKMTVPASLANTRPSSVFARLLNISLTA